jgi:Ni/Fe-hydrogenase subunit HybB-like protein
MTSRARGLKDLLWALAFAGLVAGVLRLFFGLGATTNLSDAVPWGLWKVLNMVAGVAISTSGFTVGFLVYVLRRERFRPLVKPAILVAFLGYGCSCAALLFDIGLPQRFWHPLVMWNHHSFLFEVFWCVTLYFTVTAVELAPTIFERLRAERAVRFLHRIAFGVVVIGISLSCLHHSSLGSLFLVTPQRLHPLWYTPLLPLLFIVSAVGTGLMFVVLVRILYARWYDREAVFGPAAPARELIRLSDVEPGSRPQPVAGPAMPMLSRVAAIAGGVLGLYLLLQIVNLVVTGSWRALAAGTWESWLFAGELLISAVLPVVLVALPRTRRSPYALGIAGFSATAGLALNRLDVGIFGYFRDAGAMYFPSLTEWVLSVGVVAAAALLFLFVVENCPVFDDLRVERRVSPGMFRASFDSLSRVSKAALSGGVERTTLIAVLVVPLAWAAMYPPYRHPAGPAVRPASGLDVMRTTLRIDGDQRGVWTDFPHADHQERLGGEESCRTCHHIALPEDQSTPCSRCHRQMARPTLIFDHAFHRTAVAQSEGLEGLHPANHACAECHPAGDAKTVTNAKHCLECHEKDTHWAEAYDETAALARAVSYLDAMHRKCITCHEQEGETQGRPTLADCSTCHPSLAPRERAAAALVDRRTWPQSSWLPRRLWGIR